MTPDTCGTDADLEDIEASYGGGLFDLLLGDDDEIVGTVGLYRKSGTVVELRKMYLRKSARGKGHGKRLLEHGIAAARALGYRRIELETAAVLIEAIDLYRKYGFEPVDPENPTPRCDRAFALDL